MQGAFSRRQFLTTVGSVLAGVGASESIGPRLSRAAAPRQHGRAFQVGAYYFPNYHVDPRNEKR
ncbi:MAG: hypothetical protein GXP27_02165 [Planctomycetes bacterium]|nr:hypothetical protein [Planctomycetota bacterium]